MLNRPIIKKHEAWRSRAYLNYVKSLPCIFPNCGIQQCSDAHHIKGIGNMSGLALKAADWATMPLCRIHHALVHGDQGLRFYQWEWISRTLGRAIEEGILK